MLWDEAKRQLVIKEHGIDFTDIADVFEDSFAVYLEDIAHSTDLEIRFNIIGQSSQYGLIFVVFTYQHDDDIRLITARKAEKWMVNEYEENRKRL